ncbi:hypothetical protein D3C81_771790 [compost metagenome]
MPAIGPALPIHHSAGIPHAPLHPLGQRHRPGHRQPCRARIRRRTRRQPRHRGRGRHPPQRRHCPAERRARRCAERRKTARNWRQRPVRRAHRLVAVVQLPAIAARRLRRLHRPRRLVARPGLRPGAGAGQRQTPPHQRQRHPPKLGQWPRRGGRRFEPDSPELDPARGNPSRRCGGAIRLRRHCRRDQYRAQGKGRRWQPRLPLRRLRQGRRHPAQTQRLERHRPAQRRLPDPELRRWQPGPGQ